MRYWLIVVIAGCRQVAGLDDPLSGSAIETDASAIDLQMVSCGSTASQQLVLTDSGDVAITFMIASDVSNITLMPTTGTIAPGDHASVTVTAVADAVAMPGVPIMGELQITTDNAQIAPISIPVAFTPSGGVVMASQSTLDFGQVTTATAHSSSVSLSNIGNASISLTAGPFVDGTFTVTSASSFDLAPMASTDVAIQFDPPASQTYSYQLPLTIVGASCQPLPVVNVHGAGSTNAVLLDYTTIDFGPVACGSAADSRTVTLTNSNPTSYPFTTNVTAGGGAFSASPPSGMVPASGNTTVMVDRAAVALPATTGPVTGNLEVNVTGAGGITNVQLKYLVLGSDLSASTNTVAFGQVLPNTSRSMTVMITNNGNDIADITVTRTGSSTFTAASAFQVAAGTTKPLTITFTPTAFGGYSADFAIAAPNQCSPPLSIHTTGSGDN